MGGAALRLSLVLRLFGRAVWKESSLETAV